jgi:VIT1/CCC1 family predicted Fe2+/Mn2+ transporter
MRQSDHLEQPMSLSTFNVSQRLEQLLQEFFLKPDINFANLKELVTTQQPLAEIHRAITSELSNIKAIEQQQTKSVLEEATYQKQAREDREESATDQRRQQSDDRERERLNTELGSQTSLSSRLMQETLALEVLLRTLPVQVVHQHPVHTHTHTHGHAISDHTHSSSGTVHTHSHAAGSGNVHTHPHGDAIVVIQPNPNQIRFNMLRQELANIQQRCESIRQDLNAITERTQQRNRKRDARELRAQARLDLTANVLGSSIEKTLSPDNLSWLRGQIRSQHRQLEDQCDRVTQQARDQNYALFINNLKQYLSKGSLQEPETRALNSIISLIEQHREHSKQALATQNKLDDTARALAFNQDQLKQLKAHLLQLQNANPQLRQTNERLIEQNKTLAQTREDNSHLRDRLVTPALIVGATSLVAAVPIALTLAGIIPYVLAPALLLSLFAAPPVVLFLVAVTLAIIALVYSSRSASNTASIKANQKTIDANNQLMQTNESEINTITQDNIPTRQRTIDKYTQEQIELTATKEEQMRLAAQTLQQAKGIEPIVYAPFAFFGGSTDGADKIYPPLAPPPYQPGLTTVEPSAPPAIVGEPDEEDTSAAQPSLH